MLLIQPRSHALPTRLARLYGQRPWHTSGNEGGLNGKLCCAAERIARVRRSGRLR